MLGVALALCVGLGSPMLGAHPPSVLVQGMEAGERVPVLLTEIGGFDTKGRPLRLRRDVYASWLELVAAAEAEGFEVRPTYGWRSNADQRRLRRRLGKLAARPGYSDHQAGKAIDVSGAHVRGRLTALGRWLRDNGPSFGWCQNLGHEPWHLEFCGGEDGQSGPHLGHTPESQPGQGTALGRGRHPDPFR